MTIISSVYWSAGDWRKTDDPFTQILPPYGFDLFAHTRNGKSDYLFCDGHVKMMRFRDTLDPKSLWISGSANLTERLVASHEASVRRTLDNLPPDWR
jgi:prepilin-type processing-associated H-X9-DG protein